MARDAAKMRGDGPTVLAAVKKGDGLDEIEAGILSALHDRVGVHVDGQVRRALELRRRVHLLSRLQRELAAARCQRPRVRDARALPTACVAIS